MSEATLPKQHFASVEIEPQIQNTDRNFVDFNIDTNRTIGDHH
jgi:hypothetical protein